MTNAEAYELIAILKKVKGSIPYDGDASIQVVIPLLDGTNVRIGVTDDDVAPGQGLWFDFYKGFNGELSNINKACN